MKRFENILVAVDLSQGDRFVSADLAPPTTEAIEHAILALQLRLVSVTSMIAEQTVEGKAVGKNKE